jgi:hypothetical protein
MMDFAVRGGVVAVRQPKRKPADLAVQRRSRLLLSSDEAWIPLALEVLHEAGATFERGSGGAVQVQVDGWRGKGRRTPIAIIEDSDVAWKS